MKKRLLLLSIVFASSLFSFLHSQVSLTMYHMKTIPQSQYLNPAFRPVNKINVGIPGLSSIFLNHVNTIASPKNSLRKEDSVYYFNPETYVNELKESSKFFNVFNIELLSFGFQVKQNYFHFNVTERIDSRTRFPKAFFELLAYGNADWNQNPSGNFDMKNYDIDMTHFREYAIGWQRPINEKLDVGIRVKYLYGMENVKTVKSDFSLQTDPNTYDISIDGSFVVNTSGILDSTNISELSNDPMSYLFKRGNSGFGVDLGANYKVNDQLQVSASLKDLGYINWKNKVSTLENEDAFFLFQGINLSRYISARSDTERDSIVDAELDNLLDSLNQLTDINESNKKYTTWLTARLFLGGEYEIWRSSNQKNYGTVSALYSGEFYKNTLRSSLTLSYNQHVSHWLSASMSYSMKDVDFANIGFGIQLRGGPLQFYLVTDNILSARLTKINIGDENSGSAIYYPYNNNDTQVHLGLNLTFGNKQKDSDKDGVPNKTDECPKVAGVDGILKGCPDNDKDGIADYKDVCPNEFGLLINGGCPDTDNDGIIDLKDVCKETVGSPKFGGCPDTDNDSIIDSKDMCPNEFGLLINGGCPDRDNDSIIDAKDMCPDLKGLAINNGCPDSDNDGVFDHKDMCPLTPGDSTNNGCPVIAEKEQEVINTAFENLEFVVGSAEIKMSSFNALNELSVLLIKHDNWKLKIIGHTDDVGDEKVNMKLSEDRAKSVKEFLESKNVSSSQIITEGKGETDPVASNDTEVGRAKNRRVELNIEFE